MSLISLILILVVAVAGLALVRSLEGRSRGTGRRTGRFPQALPVAAKKYFFSCAEREFYETLKRALPAGYLTFPNVRLQDIFYITAKGEDRRGVYSRFQDKHVDFLVVEVKDYHLVLGIELDGPSRDRAEQKYRDAVKEVVFRSAGLLARFRNQQKLSPSALAVALGAYL
ncbi:DUF2726 domain-containing protein [Deinococcus cavernae]|uniref:DUF2726 domain-containing protein n=1 Tax=Deinococcus cavernae TaxID=2320857 RepID=A0A418VEW3_9DEIO|nr:DUF2726 domain-containing protein [Deinococcus cavernae]RJF74626.1 DUF2726 domain-containing protein [Deinococcus cavernae]